MKYEIIYADPPWSYDDANVPGGASEYPKLSMADLACLPVATKLAADNCVLFLWGTYPLYQEALDLIRVWGFEYKSIAFQWIKTYPKSGQPCFGLGRWTRGNTEPCLLATRGKPKRAAVKVEGGRAPGGSAASVSQLVFWEGEETLVANRGQHSAKPPEVRDRIVQLMGDIPRIELFARQQTSGWDFIGNELDGRDIRDVLK